MATKAQLLAAAKKIVADSQKAPKRKTNPAKRKGTKKPLRASQITGKAPTKRLVRRRKTNTQEGYFPNPSEIGEAYAAPTYYVVVGSPHKTMTSAAKAAETIASKVGTIVRVMRG